MKDPAPLRVSEWSAPTGPRDNPPPPPPPVGALPQREERGAVAPTPDRLEARDPVLPAPAAAAAVPAFRPAPTIFQGFDLLRIPMALLRRWWVPVLLALVGGGLGLAAGLSVFTVTSTVSARLMVRNPQAFAVSTVSYSPSRLQGSTLLGALVSPQVAREVAAKFGEGLTAAELQDMVAVQEVRKTDFVDIVVTAPLPAEQTAALATLWANEALAFTSRLQAQESSEMKAYLTEQLMKTDRELEELNKKIAAMREQSGVVDVEKETDAYLKSLGDLDLRYETVRVDLEATAFQLESLRKEIRKHSPSFEELKVEEAKLNEMAEYYTDQNPVYQEALERVKALRAKVEKDLASGETPISEFTGSYVGNALYLQILELESRRENLLLQQAQLEDMRAKARERLKDLPKLGLIAAPLLESAQTLRAARDALTNRMQEVAVFEELAPGYFRTFKTPTARDVVVGSRTTRLAAATIAGGFVFFVLCVMGLAGLEFLDRTVRTPAEAEAALQCPGLARISLKTPAERRSQEIWASVIGSLASGRTRTFWMPVASPAAGAFWEALLDAGRRMEIRILVVHLAGELPAGLASLPRVASHQLQSPPTAERVVLLEMPPDLDARGGKDLVAKVLAAQKHFQEIWIETSGLAREPGASVVREFPETILLCALGAAERSFWHTQRTLLATNKPLRGTVALG